MQSRWFVLLLLACLFLYAQPVLSSPASDEINRLYQMIEYTNAENIDVEDHPLIRLQEMGDEALPEISAVIGNDSEPAVLRLALLNHFWVGNEETLDSTVVDIVEDSTQDPALRSRCVSALSMTGLPQYVPLFINTLQDGDPKARQKSANALGRYCDFPEFGDAIRSALIAAVTDDNLLVRINSVRALGTFPHPESRQTLRSALEKQLSDGCSNFREKEYLHCENLTLQILESISRLPDLEDYLLIEEVLLETDYTVSQRMSAAKAMGALDVKRSWDILKMVIENGDIHEVVRLHAVIALLESSCPGAQSSVLDARRYFNDPYSQGKIDAYLSGSQGGR